MRFLHLSDLHLGKRVNEFPMLEDQKYILDRILDIAAEQRQDAVLIAGDIYDKPVPPAEAVSVFDGFIARLAEMSLPVLAVSGNHDSPERIAFASGLLSRAGVYFSPVYDGDVRPITLRDGHGPVDFYLLPFIKPAHVRRCFPELAVESYTDAVGAAIARMDISPERRSVLVTHQFVTGAARCDSEELSVGGSDNVDAGVFAPFDYVALGHLHGAQSLADGRIRYCGSPLKYSFSEAAHVKSVTVVDMDAHGRTESTAVPLVPLRDMAELRGEYMQLTDRSFYSGIDRRAYMHITLTDENDVPEAVGRLRAVYPNLMKLDYDNARTRSGCILAAPETETKKSPLEMFGEFYEQQNGRGLSEEQRAFLAPLIEKIWEAGE